MAKKKQRGNGAGTVYPRKNKDGKTIGYRGSYIVNGKRFYVSAKTKTETEQKLRQAMTDADRGLMFEAGTLTLGDYLDMWLRNIEDTIRQRTWERYEQIVRVHLKPTLGLLKLKSLTPTHLRGLYREKLDAGASNRTVQYIHTTLRRALQDAVTDELILRNVADGIKAPRPKKKEINPLSPEQVRTFLEATRDDPLEALYVLAIHRGLRQGELLGLKWDDVNLEAATLHVRRTLSLTRDGHVFEQPKNGKGRSIEFTQSAADALRSHLQRQLKEIEALGDEYQDQGLIFPGERGQPMRPWTLTRKLQRILERVGLPHIRFHDLRHTCATLLLGKGVHPKFVQELLGHATISTTIQRYKTLSPVVSGSAKGEWHAAAGVG